MTDNSTRRTRPPIPIGIQREIWAKSAGRCQFRGCNKLLYIDGVSQSRSNLGIISHIVGWSSDGPRGHPERSVELELDITNLMLTCRDHGKVVDDKDKVDEYPEGRLQEFKKEHEFRVKTLTDVTEESKTHVMLLNAEIDRQLIGINPSDAYQAILPKYSDSENPTEINLSGLSVDLNTDGYFSIAAESIGNRVRAYLASLPQGGPSKPISIFALAPIPLLVQLGYTLGDTSEVDLFQRHRASQSWTWQSNSDSEDDAPQLYEIDISDEYELGNAPLVVAISISADIRASQIVDTVGDDPIIYSIRANEPSLDFLSTQRRLSTFSYEFRQLLEKVRVRHGRNERVHLILAVPAPIAIEIGRCIRNYHPVFDVYEYQKPSETYRLALVVNE